MSSGSKIAGAVSRIRALSSTSPIGFWFLTDLHVPFNHGDSAQLLARLIDETGIRTVVCGGDIPEAFGNRAALDASFARYREHWVTAIERAHGDFFPIRGNHDRTIRFAPDSPDGFTYPAEETRDFLLDTAAVQSRATVDSGSCAYFVDFPENRFRLVIADTSDSVTDERTFWAVNDTMSDRQALWLAENAIATLRDGWCAVIASHIPFAGVAASDDDKAQFAMFRSILEAYQARGIATVSGRKFDFSYAKGRIALAISGHYHAELQSCVKGIWHVSEPCDAAYLDYINRSKPWCPDLPIKERGTWSGQTFDAVQIDPEHGLVHFTRIGGGSDRTLHLASFMVPLGKASRLSASFSGAGQSVWGVYDADRALPRPNPAREYDYFTDYFNNVADITPEGAVRAIACGEAIVVATATNGVREYFPVVVR